MRGRPPKPSAVHELEGTRQRNAGRQEPRPGVAAPKCPTHLKGEARREWNRIVPELKAIGVLTLIDRAALAGYCMAWATAVEAEGKVHEAGLVVKTKQGNVIPNPYLGVRNSAMKLMRAFLTEFGLTPSSRTRLSVTPADEGDDIAAFLNSTTPQRPRPT